MNYDERVIRVKRAGILKKASYEYIRDQTNLTDVVTAGFDINAIEDASLIRLATQECFVIFKDMQDHTNFSKEEWSTKLGSLLKNAGVVEDKRITNIVKSSVKNLFEYLRSNGW